MEGKLVSTGEKTNSTPMSGSKNDKKQGEN